MTSHIARRLFVRNWHPLKYKILSPAGQTRICSHLCSSSSKRQLYFAKRGTPRFTSAVATQPSFLETSVTSAKSSIRAAIIWEMSAQLAKPFTVYVIQDAESDEAVPSKRKFRLMFRYTMDNSADVNSSTTSDPTDHLVNFERDYDDRLESTLMRIRMKLTSLYERGLKMRRKKEKRAKVVAQDSGTTNREVIHWKLRVLTADGTELKTDVTNEVAFLTEGRSLVINEQVYDIFGPTPSITKAEVDLIPLVGYPIMPAVNVGEGGSMDTCQYFWFTGDQSELEASSKAKAVESVQVVCDHDQVSGALRIHDMKGMALKSTNRIFIAENADAGRHLCLVVTSQNTAGRYGLPRVWTTPVEKQKTSAMFRKGVIIAPPTSVIWEERHRLCADWTPKDTFRCISYNILADLYMNLTLPDHEMYFPFCPKRYQEHSYRYPLLLKEISGYKADLCCLQEVDTRMYDRYLEPYLSVQGWRGITKRKGGVVNEGSAIFYRPEKFELFYSDDHVLSDLIQKSDSFTDLAQVAKQDDTVWNVFLTRPHTVQVSVFRCLTVPNSYICVANTHLHFKPHQAPIRILQAALGYRHLLNVAARTEKQYPGGRVGVIFCGDFNSTPRTGVYGMFQNGRLDADHPDWKPEADNLSAQGCNEDVADEDRIVLAVQGIDLTFTKPLRSACPSVKYTTSTHLFRDALDHIFVSDELAVDRMIPMPDHDLVIKHTGIPSPICPSDHLPVICELKFT